jgi:hypothetical protein
MIIKSKKTIAAEKELKDLQGRLEKARADLDKEFETALTGDRIPAMSATVTLLERRAVTLSTGLHGLQVVDAVEAIARATAAHEVATKKCAEGKAKHLADCIAAHPKKPAIGRKLGKDREFAPEWLRDLRQKRHDTHQGIMEAYRDLRDLDPNEARKRGINHVEDYVVSALPGPVEA